MRPLPTQSSTLNATSSNPNPATPASPTSSNEVEDIFNTPTPALTPSPPPSVMEDNRDAPPHQPGANPPADQALPQAMTALMVQLQNAPAAQPRARSPAPAYDNAPHARIKACDPDPYDGTDPTKLRAFLSQCKLMFCACP